jgi:hypothetical protein
MNLRPYEWNVVIVTSTKSVQFYKDVFSSNDIVYLTHPLLDNDSFDIEDYNMLMKSPFIWEQLIKYDNCLTIQDDGMIVRKGLEEMFVDKYDYVGSPWAKDPGNEELATAANPNYVGNGGLSLRNTKRMLEIAIQGDNYKNLLFNNDLQPLPEDVFFAHMVHKGGGRIPDHATASLFAAEQVASSRCFGFHKPWAYLTFQDVMTITQGM